MSNRKRYLAPWRREAAELQNVEKAGKLLGFENPEAMEKYLASLRGKPAIYHCVSRIVDRRRIFGIEEKEKFTYYMRVYEEFCQVRILTWCLMGNHFHILVEIPEPPEDRGKSWSDEKFLRHISCRYRDREFLKIASRLKHFRKQGLDRAAEELRDKFFALMWDLSWFLRMLKQRFAQWYNAKNNRDGVLWSDRFRSLIVESGLAARTVAAYIDLNPVRAGIVADPKDYRWSGYGEAIAGFRRAREGLRLVVFGHMSAHHGKKLGAKAAAKWKDVSVRYRCNMFLDGRQSQRDEKKHRAGIPSPKVDEVLEKDGKLSAAEMLRCRMAHLTRGVALGSGGFIDTVGALTRGILPSIPRPEALKDRTLADTPLRALRGLRNEPLAR